MRHAQGWLVPLLLACGIAHGDEWREIPYKEVARMQLVLEKVDTDRVFTTSYSIKRADGRPALPPNLRVEVVAAGKAVPLQVDPDGKVHLPIRQDWVDNRATIRINQPKGSMTLSYGYKARTPPGTRMHYSRLTESLQVMERGIEQAAGLLSFLAPEPYALGIMFPSGPQQEVVLTFPDGSVKRFRSSGSGSSEGIDNRLELPWNPDWQDAEVTFSAPPRSVLPLMK
ncbi:Protein of unknown function (DUF2987) [Luteimonas cucumeris]|uniref:Uncharacterized protein n=1 Tax=Luteimonas cucumeris TaxID=985012 RepID=A0A562LFC4_9GAMM|nr:DUF2987 domain-containing protein [Luteimonas cucumeris]TWI06306.1 Protein of unknown function (DUF2987) [Luteimonas cucumeris]